MNINKEMVRKWPLTSLEKRMRQGNALKERLAEEVEQERNEDYANDNRI